MLKIQLCITGINYILQYITIVNCIFDQINAALVTSLKNITYLKSF